EFVDRRRWLKERSFADLVALCQFLPGPASSQVGIAIGLARAGYVGAVAAWLGFTLPPAFALVLFGYGVSSFGNALDGGWLHGLKVAAVAVVALAILGMVRTLTPDRERAGVAALAAVTALAIDSVWGQIGAIVLGALAGIVMLKSEPEPIDHIGAAPPASRAAAILALAEFAALLVGLPIMSAVSDNADISLFDMLFRAG